MEGNDDNRQRSGRPEYGYVTVTVTDVDSVKREITVKGDVAPAQSVKIEWDKCLDFEVVERHSGTYDLPRKYSRGDLGMELPHIPNNLGTVLKPKPPMPLSRYRTEPVPARVFRARATVEVGDHIGPIDLADPTLANLATSQFNGDGTAILSLTEYGLARIGHVAAECRPTFYAELKEAVATAANIRPRRKVEKTRAYRHALAIIAHAQELYASGELDNRSRRLLLKYGW